MTSINKLRALATKCILLILFLSIFHIVFAQSVPKISVSPSTISVYVNQNFSINITVSNVTDLHAIDVKLRYNTIILDALQVAIQPPWPQEHAEIFDPAGYVWINSTLPTSLNGTTTIASITFKGALAGQTTLNLADTTMLDLNNSLIGFIRKDGTVTVSIYMIKVPYDYATIQEAINAAKQGDTIFVYEGIYKETISINKSITLLAQNLNTVINGEGSRTVINITASYVTLQGFTIENSSVNEGCGINILSNGNSIIKNVITMHNVGLQINSTSGTYIINNTLELCTTGASVNASYNIYFLGNMIRLNSQGIVLSDSSANIENSEILNNTYGLIMINCSNTKIARNQIAFNEKGLDLINSTNNLILRNNFQNGLQLILTSSANNSWDNGVEGNYWSDYSGQDLSNPPDGIGDTNIPHLGVDNYPLILPYITGDVNHDGRVDPLDLGTLGATWGSFPEDPKWNVRCDLNEDESIDPVDLGLMGVNWGKSL
jgi:parallel beta-helix repeat protein